MATKWVITTPSDHVELDETQQGQVAFTVTNPSARTDRVVFDVVPGDGADPAWFTVEEPQRRVAADGSVTYLVRAAVPATAPPGTYSVQGRAYSADSTPEEDSVLGGRLVVQVAAKAPPPPPKKRPWWILVVAGLVVVVVVVVGLVVGLGGSHPPAPAPSAQLVGVPNVAKQSESQAATNLTVIGLKVGTVRHKVDATPDTVIYQSVAGGAKVPTGTAVDLVVTTALAPPVMTAPKVPVPAAAVAGPTVPVPTSPVLAGASASPVPSPSPSPSASRSAGPVPSDVLTWTDPDPFVHRWQVVIQQQVCAQIVSIFVPPPPCYILNTIVVEVDRPGYTPILRNGQRFVFAVYNVTATNVYQWSVAPVDDFGGVGGASAITMFAVQ